jgi:hypothetical protein
MSMTSGCTVPFRRSILVDLSVCKLVKGRLIVRKFENAELLNVVSWHRVRWDIFFKSAVRSRVIKTEYLAFINSGLCVVTKLGSRR